MDCNLFSLIKLCNIQILLAESLINFSEFVLYLPSQFDLASILAKIQTLLLLTRLTIK